MTTDDEPANAIRRARIAALTEALDVCREYALSGVNPDKELAAHTCGDLLVELREAVAPRPDVPPDCSGSLAEVERLTRLLSAHRCPL